MKRIETWSDMMVAKFPRDTEAAREVLMDEGNPLHEKMWNELFDRWNRALPDGNGSSRDKASEKATLDRIIVWLPDGYLHDILTEARTTIHWLIDVDLTQGLAERLRATREELDTAIVEAKQVKAEKRQLEQDVRDKEQEIQRLKREAATRLESVQDDLREARGSIEVTLNSIERLTGNHA